MNTRWKKLMSMLAVMLVSLSLGTSVIADDHDDDDDNKHEYFQKDHDNDDADVRTKQQRLNNLTQQTEYWSIWSREPRNDPNNALPIASPEELIVIVNGNETSIYCIPQDGQLLVSGNAIAEIMGAQAKFYPQHKIAVLNKGNLELIVKAGSNAVFENKVKTPMPTIATCYENSVYLPVSVAANALGYRVTWDITKKAMVLQSI
ncbi:copper amine oxidase N-terminal domain-containing protein [Neobacillus sp.]|uniref:copper amine oxidase N-terminal domain-containing protein n=1 Tax=Neobacillus sp. TaxID=2675273 RepID=UPI002896CB73|nr:copper amine oxidase N-terminal domain-containing protein [Neobacillus sp.]